MRRSAFAALAMSFGSALSPQEVAAQNCDAVLIQQIDWSKASESQITAWIESIDERSFETAKRAAGGQAYFGMFSGSYESFDQKRKSFLADRRSFNSIDNAREAYKAFLSKDQTDAWVKCKGADPEILVTYEDVDRDGGFVTIHWRASPAIGGLREVQANIAGV